MNNEKSGRTESWHTGKSHQNLESPSCAFLRAQTAFGFEYLISFCTEHSDAEILIRESKDFFSKFDPIIKRISSRRFKGGEISEHGFLNFPENWQN